MELNQRLGMELRRILDGLIFASEGRKHLHVTGAQAVGGDY